MALSLQTTQALDMALGDPTALNEIVGQLNGTSPQNAEITSGTISGVTINAATIGGITPCQAQTFDLLNNQVGTTYGFILTDGGKVVTLNNGSAITATVPTNASIAFPVGTKIVLAQLGAGQVTVAAAGGVTVSQIGGTLKMLGQFAVCTLRKIATNTWLFNGDVAAS